MKIKKGDKVKVLRGNDAGREGQVLQIVSKTKSVVVEGANMRYRHLRARRANEQGQRVEFPAPIKVSNVMLVCPKCSKPTRSSYQVDDGKKNRLCKKCQASFE